MRTINEPDLLLPRAANEPVVLRLRGDAGGPVADDGGQPLELFVGDAATLDDRRLPVAGRYTRDGEWLRFDPAFALVAGQDYVVRTRGEGEPFRLTAFRLPAVAPAPDARVTEVYPSGSVLPENVLRFYLHFSVPMAPHRASAHIQLRDESGRADPAALMSFKQELWNADRTRLTVLIDPGRIKRSIPANLDLGPALLEGRRYSLTVDEGWPSADGASTLPAFSKVFEVGAALRRRPEVERWRWTPPGSGTTEPFVVAFDRPFDRHLLEDTIQVVTDDGSRVDGTTGVGGDETSWSFVPAEPWPAGGLRLRIADSLEDVAGNNLRELLDRDIRDRDIRDRGIRDRGIRAADRNGFARNPSGGESR